MPIGNPQTSSACAFGTPQDLMVWQKETVCDQNLPALDGQRYQTKFTEETSNFTNTLNALIWIPIREYDNLCLRFICKHSSAAASKSATARIWLARQSISPANPPAAPGQGSRFDFEMEPCLDLTIATTATPPYFGAQDHPNHDGVNDFAYADALAVSTAYIATSRYSLQGNVATVKGTLQIDHWGAKYLIMAIKRGTFDGVRVGHFGF
jgi:hypothetical protein